MDSEDPVGGEQPEGLSYVIVLIIWLHPIKRFAGFLRLSKEAPTVAVYTQRRMCNSGRTA